MITEQAEIDELVTIKDALRWTANELKIVFPATSEMEAKALVAGLLDCSFTHLVLNTFIDLPEGAADRLRALVARRKMHEPVAYLFGRKNFLGRDFFVSPAVLIPRPETEFVVETALKLLSAEPTVLDVGTGSGCVGLSIAISKPKARVICTDISPEALCIAKKNAALLDVKNVEIFESNIMADLPPAFQGHFDMIISNPPYISASEFSSLDPDLEFEPRLALDGGQTGLAVIEPLVAQSIHFLKSGGQFIIEIGSRQGREVGNVMRAFGYDSVVIERDYLGRDRLAKGVFRGSV